MAYH